jgi:predicted metal-dependent phosphoesterase TrpH
MSSAMRHRFDLHTHSFYSADAADSPEELIARAKARGLSGIAITDHDSCEVHKYLRKKGLEREDGQAVDGFLVVPGMEVSTADGHLLCLGVLLPVLAGQPAVEVAKLVAEQGGIAIPAHPYDSWRAGIKSHVLDAMEIKAIEVFNAAVSTKSFNEQALAYATERGLAMTASSDAHHASAVGVSCTVFEMEELSVSALIRAIEGGGTPEGRYLSFAESMKKNFGNLLRSANRKPKPDLG